jgi:hypothetical protein
MFIGNDVAGGNVSDHPHVLGVRLAKHLVDQVATA